MLSLCISTSVQHLANDEHHSFVICNPKRFDDDVIRVFVVGFGPSQDVVITLRDQIKHPVRPATLANEVYCLSLTLLVFPVVSSMVSSNYAFSFLCSWFDIIEFISANRF